jgi:SAM-dependent methyltransferase
MAMSEVDREFYNKYWKNRRTNWGSDSINRQVAIFYCIERIKNKNFERILDIGCGPGILTNMLSKYGNVIGIDISDEVVKENRKVFPNIEFISGDFLDIPPKRHSIDLAISSEVIEHVARDKQEDFLSRISDWLKPYGYLILTVPNRKTMERLHIEGDQLRENPFYSDDLRFLLSNSDFEIVKFLTTHFLNENKFIRKTFWYLREVYCLIDYVLRNTHMGLYIVVLARKTSLNEKRF